jgi:hypothetical protein
MKPITMKHCLLLSCVWLALATTSSPAQITATNQPVAGNSNSLSNAVIFIIRHAEKTETGMELTPAGVERANAYTNYFRSFALDSKPLRLDCLIATADSKNSQRCRLTLEPLSKSLGLPLDTRYKNKESTNLVAELQSRPHGSQILICWHHEQIPVLIQALGADPATLLPDGKWPDDVFSWVIQLRYDSQGRLIPGASKRLSENLMPGDAALAGIAPPK